MAGSSFFIASSGDGQVLSNPNSSAINTINNQQSVPLPLQASAPSTCIGGGPFFSFLNKVVNSTNEARVNDVNLVSDDSIGMSDHDQAPQDLPEGQDQKEPPSPNPFESTKELTHTVTTTSSTVNNPSFSNNIPYEPPSEEVQIIPEEQQFEQWSDELWASSIFREIKTAKKERYEQERLIEQKRQELEEERQRIAQIRHNIDQQKCDLEARETKLLEVEPLIPSARQLQGYGIDINQFLPWIETVHEKAETEKIDVKSTAYNLAQELRFYRQLGGLQKTLQLTEKQLEMLNVAILQKQQAISALIDLHNRGILESEIVQLARFVCQVPWICYV